MITALTPNLDSFLYVESRNVEDKSGNLKELIYMFCVYTEQTRTPEGITANQTILPIVLRDNNLIVVSGSFKIIREENGFGPK